MIYFVWPGHVTLMLLKSTLLWIFLVIFLPSLLLLLARLQYIVLHYYSNYSLPVKHEMYSALWLTFKKKGLLAAAVNMTLHTGQGQRSNFTEEKWWRSARSVCNVLTSKAGTGASTDVGNWRALRFANDGYSQTIYTVSLGAEPTRAKLRSVP